MRASKWLLLATGVCQPTIIYIQKCRPHTNKWNGWVFPCCPPPVWLVCEAIFFHSASNIKNGQPNPNNHRFAIRPALVRRQHTHIHIKKNKPRSQHYCHQVTDSTMIATIPPPKTSGFLEQTFHGSCSTQGRIRLKAKYLVYIDYQVYIYLYFLCAKAYRSMTSGRVSIEGHRIAGDTTRGWF